MQLISDGMKVMKTSEMQPVIRCKDCKHWYKHHCSHGICATEKTDPDWFCADGERKDDNDG